MQPIRNRNPLPIQATVNNRRNRGRLRTTDLTAKQNNLSGEVLDLSATGMRVRFLGKTEFKQDELIGMTLAWDTVSLPVRGKIVWVRAAGRKDVQIGVHFEELNDSESAAIRKLAMLAGDAAMGK